MYLHSGQVAFSSDGGNAPALMERLVMQSPHLDVAVPSMNAHLILARYRTLKNPVEQTNDRQHLGR